MTSCEPVDEELLRPEEMGKVGTRELPAGQAGAVVLDGPRVVLQRGVPEVEPAARDPDLPVAGDARRENGVEEVHPEVDRLEERMNEGLRRLRRLAMLAARFLLRDWIQLRFARALAGINEGVRLIRGTATNQPQRNDHVLVTGGGGVPTSAMILGKMQ